MTQIKSWKTGKVLFEYEGTLKDAVEEAVRQGVSLSFANLEGADLKRTYLNNSTLESANLRGANLSDANLSDANLEYAYLYGANLKGAYLRDASLYRANLCDADLRGAGLNNSTLKSANLRCANLKKAKGIPDDIMPLACPAEGSFIAWKKVDDKLVKLEIPADAKRSSATTKKCRCSKAKVLAITDLDETETFDEVFNGNYIPLTYKVGEMVYPDSFDENRWNECSNGIHFFMDKEDAINW